MLLSFYRALLDFPRLLLVSIATLTVFFASFIPQLKIDASSDSLLLEGDASLQIYRDVTQTFGTSDFLFLAFRPTAQSESGVFSAQTMQQVSLLSERLRNIEGVESVVSYLDVPLLYSPKVNLSSMSSGVRYLQDPALNLDLARQEFANSPVYKQLLTSQDESTLAIQINIRPADAVRELRYSIDSAKQSGAITSYGDYADLASAVRALEQLKQSRYRLEKQLVADVRQTLDELDLHQQVFVGG
ncbi:MAG: hypothetical protein HRU21_07995, partial [Pseudomonadales bacterium]|nr:hypothetical protein [Pseudomonadales bacterium]